MAEKILAPGMSPRDGEGTKTPDGPIRKPRKPWT